MDTYILYNMYMFMYPRVYVAYRVINWHGTLHRQTTRRF